MSGRGLSRNSIGNASQHSEGSSYDVDDIISASYPAAKGAMEIRVKDIISAIVECDPRILLSHCRLHQIVLSVKGTNNFDDLNLRALEYIQNILVTHTSSVVRDMSVCEMRDQCEDVIRRVEQLYQDMPRFVFTRAVMESSSGSSNHSFDASLQIGYWIRGKRDYHFNERYFRLLLGAHNETFLRFFGIGSEEVIQGILSLLDVLRNGKCDIVQRWATLARNSQRTKLSRERCCLDQIDGFLTEIEDLDVYDVAKITHWPDEFIEQFSYSLGECCQTTHYEYQFWPIDDLVIKDRPFVKICDKCYCFDYYNFQDNFYRAIFGVVKRYDGSGSLWHRSQTVAIESAASSVFANLLPGCRQFKNVYYYPNNKKNDRRELDLVVLGPGVTIFIEAKGVCLEHASPTVDPHKARKFYENALEKGGHQCEEVREYMRKAGGLRIYTESGDLVRELSREEIGEQVFFCVTADSSNEVASSPSTLKDAGVTSHSVVFISLDDLLIYELFFDSPMVFLAYLSQRIRTTNIERIFSSDELDHLGMFLYKPNYADWLRSQDPTYNLMIGDNRLELDPFFRSLDDRSVDKPSVYLPAALKNVLDECWNHDIKQKYRLACCIIGLDNAEKDWLARMLIEERQRQENGGLPRVYSHPRYESDSSAVGVSLYLQTPWVPARDEWAWKKSVFAVMLRFNERARCVIRITVDPAGRLTDAAVEKIDIGEVPPEKYPELKRVIELIDARVEKRICRERNRPGRNEICPCGSGRKFKHCCGREK